MSAVKTMKQNRRPVKHCHDRDPQVSVQDLVRRDGTQVQVEYRRLPDGLGMEVRCLCVHSEFGLVYVPLNLAQLPFDPHSPRALPPGCSPEDAVRYMRAWLDLEVFPRGLAEGGQSNERR